jgi:uncharacterized protein
MKKFLSIFLLLLCVNLFAQKSIPKPNPPRLVVDNAGVLNSYDAEQLEKKLVALDDSTSNQIAVVTVNSLNGEVIEEVANKKIRIEVGYGLEGAITDVQSKDIIENDLKPAFRANNFYGGINKAVDDLSKAAVGEYKVKRNKSSGNSGGSILGFIIILFVVLMIVGNSGRGGGGGMMSRRGFGNIAETLLWANLLGGGRSSGGGGWSGGGDSGGGFGGFGGGDSGGGGASGGW